MKGQDDGDNQEVFRRANQMWRADGSPPRQFREYLRRASSFQANTGDTSLSATGAEHRLQHRSAIRPLQHDEERHWRALAVEGRMMTEALDESAKGMMLTIAEQYERLATMAVQRAM